jgi:hypothetical protein
VEVHFIGRLQSNKVAMLAPLVDVWQSVDRPSLVEAIARRAPGARVFVQVNVSDEPQKGGCAPADAAGLVALARRAGLQVDGLMCVGRTGPPEDARPGFRALRQLADDVGVAHRSMGMTDDLEVAVQEGSTMIRVGTALFGRALNLGYPPIRARNLEHYAGRRRWPGWTRPVQLAGNGKEGGDRAMAGTWRKAMHYLGLGPDDEYDDYEPAAPAPVRAARPVAASSARARAPNSPPEPCARSPVAACARNETPASGSSPCVNPTARP